MEKKATFNLPVHLVPAPDVDCGPSWNYVDTIKQPHQKTSKHNTTTITRQFETQDMGNKPSSQPPMKWPQMPWTDRLLLSVFCRLHDLPRCRDGTVNRRLLPLFYSCTAANPNPVSGVCTFDLTIDSSRNMYARVFVPSDPSIQGVNA